MKRGRGGSWWGDLGGDDKREALDSMLPPLDEIMKANGAAAAKGRTSEEAPIRADMIPTETLGNLYVTFAPGKKQTGKWNRDLGLDLAALAKLGCKLLVSLVEDHELRSLKIEDLAGKAADFGIAVLRFPIPDVTAPRSMVAVDTLTSQINAALRRGDDVVVHCKGGLGRAGTIAACTLVARGKSPKLALVMVRKHRPGAVETTDQERFIADYRKYRENRRTRKPTSFALAPIKPAATTIKTEGPLPRGFDDEDLCICFGKPAMPTIKGTCKIHPDR